MKNSLLTLFLLVILIIVLIEVFIFFTHKSPRSLISPNVHGLELSPTPSPSPTPIIFYYNSSTDLKAQLQTINPKVEDPDLDTLKNIINSL